MKKRSLSIKETIIVASTLFGMFFGAGNLIFPIHLGQIAGARAGSAMIGFVITAVSIPILGVAAIGNTHSENLLELSSKVNRKFAYCFTTLLYLTIGPFFAIPRCCTTSFTTGIEAFTGSESMLPQLIFSAVFFAVVLYCSWSSTKITLWIGKVINPIFLIFLAILLGAALLNPSTLINNVTPVEPYDTIPFFSGFVEGYGTMDAIAGLAFGIVIIEVVRGFGISDDDAVAKATVRSGILTGVLMGLIYIATIVVGAQSRGLFEVSDNGGIALAEISNHYLGTVGSVILAITVTAACLKTAIGLVTSCAEMFVRMFHRPFNYRGWALVFTLFSFAISNVGLTALINYSLPVLMLLYPFTIVLIIVALLNRFFSGSKYVYNCAMIGAGVVAILDCLKTMPEWFQNAFNIPALTEFALNTIPWFDRGLGWVVPAIAGFVVGLAIHLIKDLK